jgi:hypothetical protein
LNLLENMCSLGDMKPYSNDLRRALVVAYENRDYSQQEVADLFGGSPATVRNIVRRKRETGTPDAKPRGGGELVLPTGANLHTLWDSQLGPDLVPDALDAESDEALVRTLVSAPAPAAANEETSIPDQVIGWVNASLAAARAAYQGLRITGFRPRQAGDYPVEWEGEAAYRQRCAPIVSERMAAVAANLAAPLDTIWP